MFGIRGELLVLGEDPFGLAGGGGGGRAGAGEGGGFRAVLDGALCVARRGMGTGDER